MLGSTSAERAVANTLCLMDADEYSEQDGTRYRVQRFCGSTGKPPEYLSEFCGAIAEWGPGAKSPMVILFRDAEFLDMQHANISAVAERT